MVKYELTNELFNFGIQLILWSSDIILDYSYLYSFKYVTVEKYNNGWQLSFNNYTKFDKG